MMPTKQQLLNSQSRAHRNAIDMPKLPDANDLLKKIGPDGLRRAFDEAKPIVQIAPEASRSEDWWRSKLINATALCDLQFPKLNYVVPGIFPEGVTLLASRPKLGKSWLLLQIGTAVATGVAALASADDKPAHGDVLYLALEDNHRRLQRRLTKYFGLRRETWPARLTIATEWKRLDQGGLEAIKEWCKLTSVNNPT
jgi:hypothetical protein